MQICQAVYLRRKKKLRGTPTSTELLPKTDATRKNTKIQEHTGNNKWPVRGDNGPSLAGAPLVGLRPCKAEVVGSNPIISTKRKVLGKRGSRGPCFYPSPRFRGRFYR